jgi:hypothetical protein
VFGLGCSGRTGSGDAELDQARRFETKMCACRDRACAEHVNAEIDAWARKLPSFNKRSGLSEEAARKRGEQLDAIEAETRRCKRAARRS